VSQLVRFIDGLPVFKPGTNVLAFAEVTGIDDFRSIHEVWFRAGFARLATSWKFSRYFDMPSTVAKGNSVPRCPPLTNWDYSAHAHFDCKAPEEEPVCCRPRRDLAF